MTSRFILCEALGNQIFKIIVLPLGCDMTIIPLDKVKCVLQNGMSTHCFKN